MSLEIWCQCEGTTGRAGRGEDSLYTDNDWGPYCEDCWGDADYWRCLTDEKLSEIERLRMAARRFLDHLEPQYEPSVDEMTPQELDRYVCHPFAVAEFSGALSGSVSATDGDEGG